MLESYLSAALHDVQVRDYNDTKHYEIAELHKADFNRYKIGMMPVYAAIQVLSYSSIYCWHFLNPNHLSS